MKTYSVYIAANLRGARPVLYIGVTGNLERRFGEHRLAPRGFAKKYHTDTLVYVESFGDVHQAIARETQLKGWTRAKKIALIEGANPTWRDLGVVAPLDE